MKKLVQNNKCQKTVHSGAFSQIYGGPLFRFPLFGGGDESWQGTYFVGGLVLGCFVPPCRPGKPKLLCACCERASLLIVQLQRNEGAWTHLPGGFSGLKCHVLDLRLGFCPPHSNVPNLIRFGQKTIKIWFERKSIERPTRMKSQSVTLRGQVKSQTGLGGFRLLFKTAKGGGCPQSPRVTQAPRPPPKGWDHVRSIV